MGTANGRRDPHFKERTTQAASLWFTSRHLVGTGFARARIVEDDGGTEHMVVWLVDHHEQHCLMYF
jgi:hypothetical protein